MVPYKLCYFLVFFIFLGFMCYFQRKGGWKVILMVNFSADVFLMRIYHIWRTLAYVIFYRVWRISAYGVFTFTNYFLRIAYFLLHT